MKTIRYSNAKLIFALCFSLIGTRSKMFLESRPFLVFLVFADVLFLLLLLFPIYQNVENIWNKLGEMERFITTRFVI